MLCSQNLQKQTPKHFQNKGGACPMGGPGYMYAFDRSRDTSQEESWINATVQ